MHKRVTCPAGSWKHRSIRSSKREACELLDLKQTRIQGGGRQSQLQLCTELVKRAWPRRASLERPEKAKGVSARHRREGGAAPREMEHLLPPGRGQEERGRVLAPAWDFTAGGHRPQPSGVIGLKMQKLSLPNFTTQPRGSWKMVKRQIRYKTTKPEFNPITGVCDPTGHPPCHPSAWF